MLDPYLSNVALIDSSLDSRANTFENPTGARGAGGSSHNGRKGAPSRRIRSGETVTLADIEGPGILRHMWVTFPPAPPEEMRAVTLEVSYGGALEPSVSVPILDFFGLPHGRPTAYHSALTSVNEGRGFNSFIPMPFHHSVRVELTNHGPRTIPLYYQVDYTLQPELPAELGYLHVEFRRENPTTQRRDFVITEGLRGPGRFLGCAVGVRVLDDGAWYGEGEVKIYRDGDAELPTICGTGLEDYVGSAWGMGAHATPYCGAPIMVGPAGTGIPMGPDPDFVGFYRWHVPDPVIFERELKVTIQQIGAMFFGADDEAVTAYEAHHPVAGEGWIRLGDPTTVIWGIAERVDDYCAAAFVYCSEPQAVPQLDVAAVIADIERRDYEAPSPFEAMTAVTQPAV